MPPSDHEPRDRRLDVVAGAVGVVCATIVLYWASMTSPWHAIDDAFITFRYAERLRQGYGFVYNVDEPVLGTTAPLFGLVLGAIATISSRIDVVVAGHWLGALAWAIAVGCSVLLLSALNKPVAGVIAALLLTFLPAMVGLLGMETPVVIMLMIVSAYAWISERRWLAVVVSSALILTRQDSVLWVFCLGTYDWWRQGRLPIREAAFTALLTLPWFAYAWLTYGSPLPNTLAAKAGQIDSMAVQGHGTFLTDFWQHSLAHAGPAEQISLALLTVLGVWVVWSNGRDLAWLPLWVVGYLAAYVFLGVESFGWYFVPPYVGLLVLSAIGVGEAVRIIHKSVGLLRLPDGAIHMRSHLLAMALAPLVLIVLLFMLRLPDRTLSAVRNRPTIVTGTRLGTYHEAGEWLRKHSAEDARLATIEIGILGYRSMRPVLDTMGLVSPEMIPHLTGWSDTLVYAITAFWPDYAVTRPRTAWDGVVPQWWFEKHYEKAAEFGETTLYALTHAPSPSYRVDTDAAYVTGLVLEYASFDAQRLDDMPYVDAWLRFRVDQPQPANFQFTYYWIDAQTNERYGQESIWPYNLEGAYPVGHWPTESQINLPIRIQVPSNLAAGTYRVGLLLFDVVAERAVPLTAAPDAEYPELQIGFFRLGDPTVPAQIDHHNLIDAGIHFEEGVVLTSVSMPDHALRPGETLPVDLHWLAQQQPERDARVFVHLLNSDGSIVAQRDVRPFDGRFPTTVWGAGERLTFRITLPIPPDLTPGQYDVHLGLYDADGRLVRIDGQGDSVFLPGAIAVEAP